MTPDENEIVGEWVLRLFESGILNVDHLAAQLRADLQRAAVDRPKLPHG